MNIESPKTTVNKSPEEVFNFLKDVKNFGVIMPENTDKFEYLGEDKFLFSLKGMPEIGMQLKEAIPNNTIIVGSPDNKFPFKLIIKIDKKNNNDSEVQFNFEGDFNPMMAMMIKGPITNFINTLSANMSKI